ncbi:MAG: hypothetical protein M1594_00820 [Candidatus Marsarchaeota archaeon]|nr:hypothetical protein [Candidatus Marsarchaeota archaeon]
MTEQKLMSTSMTVDKPEPFLDVSTRWDYLNKHLDILKEKTLIDSLSFVFIFAGIYLLIQGSILLIPAFAVATYLKGLSEQRMKRLDSDAPVILGK